MVECASCGEVAEIKDAGMCEPCCVAGRDPEFKCGGCGCSDVDVHECEYCDRECCSECGVFGEVVWCATDACKSEIERKGDAAREAYYAALETYGAVEDDDNSGVI